MGQLRFTAIAEASTLLLLMLIAVPAKHVFGYGELVRWLGPIHGLVFMGFVSVVASCWANGRIASPVAFKLLIGAMIPFGGFINERRLRSGS